MKKRDFANAIVAFVDGFFGRMEELAKGMVIEATEQAFNTLNSSGRRGRPRGQRGGKRTPQELVALEEKFAHFVEASPGLRIEQINRAIQTTTRELALPIRKLLAADRIRTEGQKRSTTYHPANETRR